MKADAKLCPDTMTEISNSKVYLHLSEKKRILGDFDHFELIMPNRQVETTIIN